jgi:hypothetical protein
LAVAASADSGKAQARQAKPKWSLPQCHKSTFTSKTFAWRACLDLDGERPLPDNFFDVFPGIPTVLEWPAALGQPRILRVGN